MHKSLLMGVAAIVAMASPAAAFSAPALSPCSFAATRSAACHVAKAKLPSHGRKSMPLAAAPRQAAAAGPKMQGYSIDLTGKVRARILHCLGGLPRIYDGRESEDEILLGLG